MELRYTNVKTNMTLYSSPLCDEAHCITAVIITRGTTTHKWKNVKGLLTRTITIVIRLEKDR